MAVPDKETKVPLPIRVPESYIDRLDSLAEKMDLERSEVARRCLRNGIDDLEKIIAVGSNPVVSKLAEFLSLLDTDPEEKAELRRLLTALSEHKRKTKSKPKSKHA